MWPTRTTTTRESSTISGHCRSTVEPAWSQLEPHGESPGARFAEAAIYDPIASRMIVYGGDADWSDDSAELGDLHALALDSLEWTRLEATGTGPTHARTDAVYDPERRRMIVLDGDQVFALELREAPAWHRFCELGVRPPGYDLIAGGARTPPVLVPDGLFVGVRDGAFRFDLSTPYCD